MVSTVLKLVGFDLQRQLASLKVQVEEFKDRTTDEIKRKAIDTGLTIGLAFVGLVLVLITLAVGLVALYLWVARDHGPFAALGVVACATAILAAMMFIVAATRGGSRKPEVRAVPSPAAWPADVPQADLGLSTAAPRASMLDSITEDLTDQAKTVVHEAVNSAADLVRKSPREAILASMAVAIMAGVLIGRRR